MSRLSRLLVVGVCLAMLVGPAAAATATVGIDAPSTVESGETVTVSLTLTNTGESADFYLLNVSVPDSWSVVGHSDDGGEFDSDDVDWLYLSVDAGTSVQPSVTYETAGDTGTAELTATAENSSGLRDIATHSITVESESERGGGGGGGSSGGGGGGGGVSAPSDGGGDESSTESPTTIPDDDTVTPTDTPTDAGEQTPAGYGDGSQTYSGSETETAEESNPNAPAGGSTATAAQADVSNNAAEPDGSSADGGLLTTGLGVGLFGALMLVGIGVVTFRRDGDTMLPLGGGVVGDSDSGGPASEMAAGDTDTNLSAVDSALADAGIEVVDLDAGQTANTLFYEAKADDDKAARVEIRTIIRSYLSATGGDKDQAGLEATILDADETLGTWHISGEWLDQLEAGELSLAAFDEKVFETVNRTD